VRPVVGDVLDEKTTITVNGTGKFLVSGPQGDTGLTGRKIIVDTYGGWAVHGGGAFSGKDPTKVDRSATYMARYIAKNCVAAGLCTEMVVRLAYVIGRAEPTDVAIDTRGTAVIDEAKLLRLIWDLFPLKPRDMIKHLNLLQPIYQATSAYGHFGREPFKKKIGKSALEFFTWEKTDLAEELRRKAR